MCATLSQIGLCKTFKVEYATIKRCCSDRSARTIWPESLFRIMLVTVQVLRNAFCPALLEGPPLLVHRMRIHNKWPMNNKLAVETTRGTTPARAQDADT